MAHPRLDLHGTAITAALGPTNTGKTHLAIQRMLGHRTGMIGLPLRLLAREVYDRVVRARGVDAVALVTGEERIVPARPRYWVATVEAMPVERPVDFLAVDEIQLCTHPTRGHVFTDRLLHARGSAETMFMGADTMAPLVERLLPTADIVRNPRLSTLRYRGPHRLTRLPPRSAVVAFGARRVYELAERLRRRHGGVAVVLGALSPRARNRQVALYQSGEVPYLVATDAIGMGLNLDLAHVALSGLRKFDGRRVRDLDPDEVAQVAGRAGRHRTDGTFGTLDEVGPLDPALVEAVEQHRFPPVQRLNWRNSDLDFRSPQALLDSLERPAPQRCFVRVHDALDHQALQVLARREHIRRMTRGADATRLLWRICQVPDYRNTLTDAHLHLLETLHGWLTSPQARVPEDELQARIRRLDRTSGDIETLMARLAWIRTWTYITHRSDWVPDPEHWQARARQVEDRLSDALHERLTERFVDRRTRMMGGVTAVTAAHPPEIDDDGSVVAMGRRVGTLRGLDFVPDPRGLPADEPHFERELRRQLRARLQATIDRLHQATPDELTSDPTGRIRLGGIPLGQLERGEGLWSPRVRTLRLDLLDDATRRGVTTLLAGWRDRLVDTLRAPLHRPAHAALDQPGRGIHFQILEGLGSVPRDRVRRLVDLLGPEDRRNLARLGIRIGRRQLYVLGLASPPAILARGLLWHCWTGARLPDPLPVGASAPRQPGVSVETWRALGYTPLGERAVRHDVVERVVDWMVRSGRAGPFALMSPPLEWMGCPRTDAPGVFAALGARPVDDRGERWRFDAPTRRRGGRRRRRRAAK
ncbi:MAG: disulfide oxidoreductase [Deltaproteobacteria bacterium]|nr:MAG: disulfide oxidoreductase [Deltaproteobacteria bacterium]